MQELILRYFDGCEDSATAGFVYTIDTTCKHKSLVLVEQVPATCIESGVAEHY